MPAPVRFLCTFCALIGQESNDFSLQFGSTFLTSDGSLRVWLNLDCHKCKQRMQIDVKMAVGSTMHSLFSKQGGVLKGVSP